MGEKSNGGGRSPPSNAVVVRRAVEEIWNQGDLDIADTLFTEGYVNAGGLVPDLVTGPEAIKIAVSLHHTAFPRLHVTIEQIVSEGAVVAFQWIARDHATTADQPTTDTPQTTLRGMTFCRLAGNKIVESRINWDQGSTIRQFIDRAGLGDGQGSPPSTNGRDSQASD